MRLVTLLLIVLVISLPFTLAVNLNYDDNGNLINGDGKFRQYNGFNELVVVRNGNAPSGPVLENYTWHPTEDRLFLKIVYEGAIVKERIFYMSENFVRVQNDSGNFDFTYVYQNGQLVAQKNPDGSKYFVHTDHLGSVSLVTDENGNIVEETFYSPFGEIISGGDELRYDYEGKEFDSNTGVYDFHARKYKPTVPKIFETPDPIIQNIYDPQTLNHYAFERNNPYGNIDPNGKQAYGINHLTNTLYGLAAFFTATSALAAVSLGAIAYSTYDTVSRISYYSDKSQTTIEYNYEFAYASTEDAYYILASEAVRDAEESFLDLLRRSKLEIRATEEEKLDVDISPNINLGFNVVINIPVEGKSDKSSENIAQESSTSSLTGGLSKENFDQTYSPISEDIYCYGPAFC